MTKAGSPGAGITTIHTGSGCAIFWDTFIHAKNKAAFTRDRFHLEPLPEWVRLGLAFTRDLNETSSRTQTGPLTKSIPFGTVPRKVSWKLVGTMVPNGKT